MAFIRRAACARDDSTAAGRSCRLLSVPRARGVRRSSRPLLRIKLFGGRARHVFSTLGHGERSCRTHTTPPIIGVEDVYRRDRIHPCRVHRRRHRRLRWWPPVGCRVRWRLLHRGVHTTEMCTSKCVYGGCVRACMAVRRSLFEEEGSAYTYALRFRPLSTMLSLRGYTRRVRFGYESGAHCDCDNARLTELNAVRMCARRLYLLFFIVLWWYACTRVSRTRCVSTKRVILFFRPTSDQVRLPAEFKHINRRRKRN